MSEKLLLGGMLAAGILLSGCGAKQTPAPAADPHAGHAHGKDAHAKDAAATGAAKVVKAQTKCPVMGNAINKSLYVDHDGKRIYLCCKGCIAPVKADPEKYIRKLEAEGVTLEKVPAGSGAASGHEGMKHKAERAAPAAKVTKVANAQTKCPVMGGGIKKSIYADHDGKRVYFCCGGCVGRFKSAPEKYLKKLTDQGVTPAKVPSGI